MSEQSTPLPPAGWYADPENDAGERWWNGVSWGEERRAKYAVPPVQVAPIPVPPVPVPPVPVAPESATGDPALPDPAAEWTSADTVAPAYVAPEERPDPYAAAATPAPYGAPPATTNPYAAPYTGQPAVYAPAAPNPNPVALVGFIISMASILLNFILTGFVGIAGGIVSAIGLAKANRLARQGVTPNGRGLALAGTIVGFVGGGLTILGFIALYAIIYAAGGY